MDLTWLGTAGFIVRGKEGEIAFDPFLSRGEGKPSPFTTKSFENTQALFVGHGHFDHTYDIPQIVTGSEVKVFAPGVTGQILKWRGVDSSRLVTASNKEKLFSPFRVRAFHSAHVHFDMPLMLSTAKRCIAHRCFHMLGLGLGYPKGLVQTYYFEVGGKKVLFVSSAGCTDNELAQYRELELDFLLAPLQGHSLIQEIMARQVAIIQPKIVIPHHHDDFYPPLSQEISVEVFREELKKAGYQGELFEIPLFESSQV